MSDAKLQSYHIFLFPFKWDYHPAGNEADKLTFRERTSLIDIKRVFDQLARWKRFEFKIEVDAADQYNSYNEFAYFHDHTRGVLAISKSETNSALQYRYLIEENAKYEIVTKPKTQENQEELYSLKINNILINFYEVGVGFISFHLSSESELDQNDILRINDLGRRMYPPFLGFNENYSDSPKQATSLPYEIRLSGVKDFEGRESISEDFSHFDNLSSVNGQPVRLPDHINKLLGKKFGIGHQQFSDYIEHVAIEPVVDDRMFTMSYVIDSQTIKPLKRYRKRNSGYDYLTNDFWYSYVYQDGSSPTCQSKPMMRKLLEKQTYDRWIEKKSGNGEPEGLLFGVTRYSFVMLADQNWFSQNILNNHFNYQYFQLVSLALVQRAAILRFSSEASRVVNIIHDKNEYRSASLISDLYLEYIYFVNKIYFREITPQEQGIELYDMLRDAMDIDRNVKELDVEIEELHKYAVLIEQEKGNKVASTLTWIATFFIPFSLMAAIFGFSDLYQDSFNWSMTVFFVCSFILLFLLIAFIFLRRKKIK